MTIFLLALGITIFIIGMTVRGFVRARYYDEINNKWIPKEEEAAYIKNIQMQVRNPLDGKSLHLSTNEEEEEQYLEIDGYYYFHTIATKNDMGGIQYEENYIRVHKDTSFIQYLSEEMWEEIMMKEHSKGRFKESDIKYNLIFEMHYLKEDPRNN